jgi:hypothetical protein
LPNGHQAKPQTGQLDIKKIQTGLLDIKNRLANWPSSKTPDWPTGYQTKFQAGQLDIKQDSR